MLDITNLDSALENLTGNDIESAEQDERLAGNQSGDIMYSKSFQSRLAAYALKCNPYDVKNLPASKYVIVTRKVSDFLFTELAEEILSKRSEKPQSPSTNVTAQA